MPLSTSASAACSSLNNPDASTVATRRPVAASMPTMVSLGSLFFEPVWLFYREDSAQRLLKSGTLSGLAQLAGWKLNIGAPGSGVPNLMKKLLEANHVDPKQITLLEQSQTPAVMALLGAESDALVFASAPESLMVQMLLQTPGIKPFFGVQPQLVDNEGAVLEGATDGNLCITDSWPGWNSKPLT